MSFLDSLPRKEDAVKRWLASQALAKNTRCLPFGDIVYLPYPLDSRREFQGALEDLMSQPWLVKHLPPPLGGLSKEAFYENPMILLALLADAYIDYRVSRNREPAWLRKTSDSCKRSIRFAYALRQGIDDPFALVPKFPYTGISYAVKSGGFTEEVAQVFDLFRLMDIRQLGYLHDPIVRAVEAPALGMSFHHSRFSHILDVYAISSLITINNGLPRHQRRLMRVAALAHDARIPAGGDTIKMVDPQAFNEEIHFPELLEGERWENLKIKYHLPEKDLIDAVQGRGVLGEVLDLADKIAYVSRDADLFISRYSPRGPVGRRDEYVAVKKLVLGRPLICGLWDAIRVEGRQVVVQSPERLIDFLLLRAYLFRGLYYHPGARFFEAMVAKVIVQYLYDTGALTREQLIAMTDADLDRLIGEMVGQPYSWAVMGGDAAVLDPRVEVFGCVEEAKRREAELVASGIAFTLVEVFSKPSNGGTEFLVKRDGNILPLVEAFPEEASRIETIIRPEDPIRLYYLPRQELWPKATQLQRAIEAYRRKQLQQ